MMHDPASGRWQSCRLDRQRQQQARIYVYATIDETPELQVVSSHEHLQEALAMPTEVKPPPLLLLLLLHESHHRSAWKQNTTEILLKRKRRGVCALYQSASCTDRFTHAAQGALPQPCRRSLGSSKLLFVTVSDSSGSSDGRLEKERRRLMPPSASCHCKSVP